MYLVSGYQIPTRLMLLQKRQGEKEQNRTEQRAEDSRMRRTGEDEKRTCSERQTHQYINFHIFCPKLSFAANNLSFCMYSSRAPEHLFSFFAFDSIFILYLNQLQGKKRKGCCKERSARHTHNCNAYIHAIHMSFCPTTFFLPS